MGQNYYLQTGPSGDIIKLQNQKVKIVNGEGGKVKIVNNIETVQNDQYHEREKKVKSVNTVPLVETVNTGKTVKIRKRVETVKGAPYHIENMSRVSDIRTRIFTRRRRRKNGYRMYIAHEPPNLLHIHIYRRSDIREVKEEDLVSIIHRIYGEYPTELSGIGEEIVKGEYFLSEYMAEMPK